MRIAVCLSGQPRTWRRTRQSLSEFFAGHEVEVFLHTWADGDPAELAELIEAYRPVAYEVEPRPAFADEKRLLAAHWPHRPPLSVFDMHHSAAGSLGLARRQGGHDLIARVRFDAMFDGRWSGEAPPAGAVIVPAGYPDPRGCNDQFALGRPDEVAAYGALGPWLTGALPKLRGETFVPEGVLRAYLEQVCGLQVIEQPIAMRLCREAQAELPFAALTDDALFHAAKHEEWEAIAQASFPELDVDFDHDARTALALDRALSAWLEPRAAKDGFQLLKAPWPRRVQAVDAFITDQAGVLINLDDDTYRGVRLMCAMLLQRMARGETMCAESFLVHALSANVNDMRKAAQWGEADVRRLEPLPKVLKGLGPLALALDYAPPFEQEPIGLWREA